MRKVLFGIILLFVSLCEVFPAGTQVRFVSLTPTIFYKLMNNKPMQIAELRVDNNYKKELAVYIRIEMLNQSYQHPVGNLTKGTNIRQIFILPLAPEQTTQITISLFLSPDDSLQFKTTQIWYYQRQWKIYLVPFSHVDVGYTHTQQKVREKQVSNLDGAIELIEATLADPKYPEGNKFRYTCEESWPALCYLEDRAPTEIKKFIDYVKKGWIEICGFYISHTNKFMSGEALFRSTYFSAERLQREYGIEVKSAIINDVGDASSVVQPLARAGIKYFQFAPNTHHYGLPPLFYLKSPSNNESQILVWIPPNSSGYLENVDWQLRPPMPSSPTEPHSPDAPLPNFQPVVVGNLRWLQSEGIPFEKTSKMFGYKNFRYDYPYAAYLIPYYPAHDGDNGAQDISPCEVARRWNEKYIYPRIIVATQSEFFKWVEKKYKDQIPILTGDFTGFWGDHMMWPNVQADPWRERLSRSFDSLMSAGEKFSTVAEILSPDYVYPQEAVNQAYARLIINNDHNPGPQPFSGRKDITEEEAREWVDVYKKWTKESYEQAQRLTSNGLNEITSKISLPHQGQNIVVYNPCSWRRTDIVEVCLDLKGQNLVLRDESAKHEIAYQITKEPAESNPLTEIIFLAEEVPPVGYKVYTAELTDLSPRFSMPFIAHAEDEQITLENNYYQLRVEQGRIVSLYDKKLAKEIVNSSSQHSFYQYVTVSRGQFLAQEGRITSKAGFREISGHISEVGPLRASIKITGAAPGKAVPTQEIFLYNQIKRVDFVQTFSNTPLQTVDNCFVYPFNIPDFNQIKVELPYNPVKIGPNDPYSLYELNPSEHGDEFIALQMTGEGLNIFNKTFTWIKGIPPDHMFRHWVDISNNEFGVTFSARESGMILAGDLESDPFTSPAEPTIYHITVGPTSWGNTALGVQEGETYTFHAILTSHQGDWDKIGKFGSDSTAAQFGWAFTNPLIVKVIPGKQKGLFPSSKSFLFINQPNIILSTMKIAEDGDGFILRLYETNGLSTLGKVTVPFAPEPFYAIRCSSVEQNQLALISNSKERSFEIVLNPGEVATVRISKRAFEGL